MTIILAGECSHKITSKISTPNLTAQIERSGVKKGNDPLVTVTYEKDVLYFTQPYPQKQQVWAKYLNINYDEFKLMRNLIYSPPHMPRLVYTSHVPATSEAIACYFNSSFFEEYTGIKDRWSPSNLEKLEIINSTRIKEYLLLLKRELITPGFASGYFVDSIGRILLIYIGRLFNKTPTIYNANKKNKKILPKKYLDNINQIIEDTHGKSVTIEEMSTVCNLSKDYLRHAFKDTTGQSLGAYINDRKIIIAKNLLTKENLLIKEIAYRTGFANDKSFCVAFKRATGETPTEYKKNRSQ